MRHNHHILILITTLLVLVGCSDDRDDKPQRNIEFCVHAAWHPAKTHDNPTSRALTSTDILTGGTGDIVIQWQDYPATIDVVCKKGDDVDSEFQLQKGDAVCSNHTTYWQYIPIPIAPATEVTLYKPNQIKRDGLTFHATAVIDDDRGPETTDDGDRLVCIAGLSDVKDSHMLLTLTHTKALLRFAFKLSEKYDKVRYILITGITVNDKVLNVAPKILNTTTTQAIAYCYLDPEEDGLTTKVNTIQCTYSIYDKDADFSNLATDYDATISANAAHLTRSGIVARNNFTLETLKDASSNTISEIRAGYYYDLRVTLNPDYLYVLSEHDNKHMTIQ